MKRLLAFIVLLSHMNTSMFLPQVPEVDIYDANGNQVDDINSVVEYVMVKLGLDHTADDEDSDNGQNFHLVKMVDYFYQPFFSLIESNSPLGNESDNFRQFTNDKISMISYDLIVPPPKV
ncbi:MAG: hypothetical protein ABI172_06525 [Ginsengibacter sp.]|jgi:hypothetical protein